MTRMSLWAFVLFTAFSFARMQSIACAERISRQQAKIFSATGTDRDRTVSPTVNLPLAAKVRRVLDVYHDRPLDARQDPPWSLLHWGIAYGQDSRIRTGIRTDAPMTAIDWLCSNRPAAGKQLMQRKGNKLILPIGPGIQGHHGQFLAMLAQSEVDESRQLRIGNAELQVRDLVEHEKRTCKSGMELTFKLIGIAHYTPSAEVWKNADGETWDVRRLLLEELDQPINRMTCCCGGTHRLFALSYAVDRRRVEGMPIDGPWATAAARVQMYQRRAFQFQNRDGSFSTMWLDRPQNSSNLTRSLITSGHILEWIAASLPDSQLRDVNFERAVNYVADVLERNKQQRWHRGALGHSLHALAIYERRVLNAKPGERLSRLSERRQRQQ